MRITNLTNLPEPLVKAVEAHDYNPGLSDITATRLLNPPRLVALDRAHQAEMTEDVSDRLWALFGSIGHLVLERAAKAGLKVAEERLYADVLGWKLGGQTDLIEGVITDYKFTSVWSCKEGLKPEWEQQLNILGWLARKNSIIVTGMEIVALYRDWSKLEARRDSSYPRAQVQVFKVPEWTDAHAETWITERVRLHQEARAALAADPSQATLSECTFEERWAKPTTYAVKKPESERARRVFPTSEEAAREMKPGEIMETRPGENVRCENYCSAAPFCAQFKKLKGTP